MADLTMKHNTDEQRYEAWEGETLDGFAQYEISGDRIVFTHTEVDPAHEGKGIGSQIARFALDDVRSQGGLRVVPRCPFIKGWIDKHPDYQDLVAGA